MSISISQDSSCSICYGTENGEMITLHTSKPSGPGKAGVAHCFHAECVRPWVKENKCCPICRESVDPSASQTGKSEPFRPYAGSVFATPSMAVARVIATSMREEGYEGKFFPIGLLFVILPVCVICHTVFKS